jgi:hypothetical protein
VCVCVCVCVCEREREVVVPLWSINKHNTIKIYCKILKMIKGIRSLNIYITGSERKLL